ncbi:hypothetical protein M378DRAFT_176096 [Amanita muscaria Koide BX008]|uniref:Uncharacterized protein n=1 Tax=Amanita muscaria (strain Koide BX008) TaxID=946122 RepID=A0A0C2XJA3_AMAMK|nr:hypothetical protein M378DRAFT_176096 [Amanita muscaria Koide BX008]
MCDNATNNDTLIAEFATHVERVTKKPYDHKKRQLRCLAHIVNLATQALLTAHSKSDHYNPVNPDAALVASRGTQRDEIGLIRAICIKERSSAQRKELFKKIQLREEDDHDVDYFIGRLGLAEKDPQKRRKITDLELTTSEWDRVKLLLDLLSVSALTKDLCS